MLLLALASAGCEAPSVGWMAAAVPEPTVFAPGVVSGAMRDYDITFEPDGMTAYFTRRSRRGPPRILTTSYVGASWTDPEPVPFASDRDEAPFVTPDGSLLLFSSRRPLEGQTEPSDNLWMVRRQGETWSAPEPVPGPVNRPMARVGRYTLGTDLGPSLLPDGSLLYWTRADPEWGADLYVAAPDGDGGFEVPVPLRANSYGDEMNPVASPDGRFIVFQAYRDADAPGGQDLYVAERVPYGLSAPRLLPEPINSRRNEGWPAFSPNGRHFFFASDRGRADGFYDIYWVDVDALFSAEDRPRSDASAALRPARR